MIVADTGVILALLDRDDAHHAEVLRLYRETGEGWVLPWAILAEVDYLVARHCGRRSADAFRSDLAEGAWVVEWGDDSDLVAAEILLTRYADLNLGLVDALVMAMAGRLRAKAIATLDLRHFEAMAMAGSPRLLPRDF